MALKLCPKEKEFSFGENSNFLRTKMKSSSNKILGLPKGVRLSIQSDDKRCSPSFVNGRFGLLGDFCMDIAFCQAENHFIIGNNLPKGEIRLELISTFILPDEDSFAFGMRLGESSVMVRYVLWN